MQKFLKKRKYNTTKSARSRARKLCHQLAQGKCAVCQRKEHKKLRHEVHHVQQVSNGGSWEQENLMLICKEHHKAIHLGLKVEPEYQSAIDSLRLKL